jgi:CAAX prenyl protease-like protein
MNPSDGDKTPNKSSRVSPAESSGNPCASPSRLPIEKLTEHSPAPFIIPLVLFLVLGMFAPGFDNSLADAEATQLTGEQLGEAQEYTANRNTTKAYQYTLLVIAQVVLGFGLLSYFSKVYRQHFPFRISVWGFLVGILGVVLWVWICKLGIEHTIFNAVGLGDWMPQRVGFDPRQIQSQVGFGGFLFFRFLLLAALVPIIEELFLRGWLIRSIDNEQWWKVGLVQLSFKACCVATLYGVITHPGEFIAAIVWFSLVTLLMKRTGNFWDCVVAHAVTNFFLGAWVIYSNDWFLW